MIISEYNNNKINSFEANKILENGLDNKRKELENKIMKIKGILNPLNETFSLIEKISKKN